MQSLDLLLDEFLIDLKYKAHTSNLHKSNVSGSGLRTTNKHSANCISSLITTNKFKLPVVASPQLSSSILKLLADRFLQQYC